MYKIIYVTTANEKEAEKIANILVEERLSACANIFPIRSIYRWKGQVEKDTEVAMFVKTKSELVDDVVKRIKESHSYDVPCIVSLSIEKGNKDFLNWIDESTKRRSI